jgi:hypothetical protein
MLHNSTTICISLLLQHICFSFFVVLFGASLLEVIQQPIRPPPDVIYTKENDTCQNSANMGYENMLKEGSCDDLKNDTNSYEVCGCTKPLSLGDVCHVSSSSCV